MNKVTTQFLMSKGKNLSLRKFEKYFSRRVKKNNHPKNQWIEENFREKNK